VAVKSSFFWGIAQCRTAKVKQAHAGLLFDLFFEAEDGSYMFLRLSKLIVAIIFRNLVHSPCLVTL
jgi:hypothetical protein